MSSKKSWSLSYELAMLNAAVEAARTLVDTVANTPADHNREQQHACLSASAVLTLVSVRLRDIGRALRGELATGALYGPHNASDTSDPDGFDVIFVDRRSKRS